MKEHSSQGRGILAALLLAIFAGFSLNAADAKFVVAAKGQRWMQTNAGAAVAVPGSNHVFMVSVDASGPDTITNGSLILPSTSVLTLEGDGDNHGGLEQEFASQGALDTAFPNGTYKIVIEGVNDGRKTNTLAITGDTYPATPQFSSFAAAQAIDPNVDFDLTWASISGATADDFINLEIVDCTDEHVVSTPPPGDPNALNGTSTNFVIRARSLRPGMMYKVKMIVAHFTAFDTTSYPGATAAAGYLKEIFLPITTTGIPVDCPPGRLQMVFNFPPGGFEDTNGVISFPQALANYSAQLEVRYETNPPTHITFTGPAGSGLNNTTNGWSNANEWGIWFSSPFVSLPPFPPGGVYVVNYGGNNWSYNLLDPNAASQQLLIIPTIVLDETNFVKEVQWRFADTNGVSVDAPTYVDNVSFSLDAMFGPLYQSNNGGEPLPRTTTSHVLTYPVPWDAVSTVNMVFQDVARNSFVSSFHRDSGPPPNFAITSESLPPGSVGRTYGATVQVNGGQSPYLWTIQNGTLPPGLSFSSETGTVAGTPTTPGTFDVLIRVVDSTEQSAERGFAIVILPNGGGGGGEPNGPDIRFFVVAKGQRWMQTNSGPAVADGGSNYVFMSFAEPNGSESLIGASLVPPGGTPVPLEGGFGEELNLEAYFASQTTLDAAFPNGDYALVTEGAHDGTKTNSLLLTGDSYPATPHISNFTAAQTIDPAADFNLTWDAISGATADDYLSVEIVDCQDDHVVSTSSPGKPDALNGTATNLLIRARSLRPGQQYKLKLLVAHFTTFDTNSYPGAMGVAGYLQETVVPLTTTGTPVDCAPGRLGFVFNFPAGALDGTNGSITFPQALEHYALHYETRGDTNPPATVTFTGPAGSGLNNSTNGDQHVDSYGAAFSSPLVNVPPFPPGGVYTVNYGGNNRNFNLLDPDAANQQVLLIPTVIVDAAGSVVELLWRYADTNGNTISPPSFVDNISLTFHSMSGPLYQVGYGDEPLPGTTSSHMLLYPIPWNEVTMVQLIFRDAAANSFISTWNRSATPPPELAITTTSLPSGIVGTNYSFTLQATGGEMPYLWTVHSGDLPPGLELNEDTGEISGAPETNGVFNVTFRVIDTLDTHVERNLILSVTGGGGGGGGGSGPAVREIVVFKGQEFLQTNSTAPVLGLFQPFHFEAFVDGSYSGAITNVVLRSPKGTNYPLELDEDMASSPAPSGGTETEGGDDGETFRLEGRFASKSALDAVFNNGNYQFQIITGSGSNRTANLNLTGDNYPATPRIANWLAAQSIDAFADFTLTWDSLSGATTNDLLMVQIEDELGSIFETPGPRQPESLNGKSTSVVIPGGTLSPGVEYKCSVFLAKFVTMNTNAYPGAMSIAAYAKATFISMNTLTPPPVQGQFQFSAASFTESESNVTAQFTITRSGGSEGDVSVDFSTANGTAMAELDYVPTEGTLNFADGETEVVYTFELIDDSVFETNETVRLVLSNPTGGATLGSQSNAVMIITDNDTPGTEGLLQFSAATYTVNESAPTVTLTVTRTGGKAGEVTVDFLTVDGSAFGDGDFTPDFGTLTFPDGVTSQTIVIGLNNDDLDETNETFEVMLDAPAGGASLGTKNIATVIITDNDTGGEIKLSSASIKVDETESEAIVTLTRSSGTAEGVTVDVTVAGGTATVDEDYSVSSETVEFAAGEATATFSLIINDDADPEGNETVLLQLSNPTGGATLGKGTNTTVLIVDDEVSFNLSAEAYTANEGSPTAVITVTRSGPITGTSTVDLSTVDGSAETDSDFVGTNVTVTFGPGVASRTVAIRILADEAVEEEETFGVELSNPDGGQLGNITEAVVSLVDNDVGGEINFKIAGFTTKEQAPVAIVIVSRTGGTASGVMFDFTTEDDGATDGDDYTGVTETIEFEAGAKEVKIEIPLFNDALDETNEVVLLSISNPTGGATLGERDSATLTIIDDDTAGVIAFSSATYFISETGATATVTVTRSSGKAGGVTVDVITSGGTATADVDYTAITNTLTFGSNEMKLTFTVDIADDSDPEINETVLMALSNPTGGGRLGSRTNAVLTIEDNERSLQFSVATTNVVEGTKNLVLTVTRTGPLKGGITVQYATANDSAIAGSDYTAKSGTLSLGSGAKSKTISIPITNDTADEEDETLTVTLSNPTAGVILGTNSSVTATIQDNDPAARISRAAGR